MKPHETPWIDVSVPLTEDTVTWPEDPSFRIRRIQALARGDSVNLSQIDMGVHTGTHVDAPLHFLEGGSPMDNLSLDVLIGPATVVEIEDPECVRVSELEKVFPPSCQRILFKTRNSTQLWTTAPFMKDFVYIQAQAASWLALHGVRLVGIDYLSVGGFSKDSTETHVALLQAGVCIVEGLNLGHVAPGSYDLVCLPLHLKGAEGAPARAVLRKHEAA